jgi:hypothetical protein
MDLLHESLNDLVEQLQMSNIPEPICGYELIGPDGSVIAEGELAWEAHRSVVLTEDQVVFKSHFEEQGWHVFISSEAQPLTAEVISNKIS